MSPEAEEVDLRDLLETYRAAVRDKFDLYDMFSSNLNASDDMLIFYFEMLSYVDAQLRELMKDRVASLLKKDIKADVLSQSSSKKNKDENVTGLFCGEKKLKIVLVRRQKSPTLSPKLLFLLGNPAHLVTRS